MAYALLDKGKETNVCIFEREDRLGGKIFDFNFTQAPNVTVGKPKIILYLKYRVFLSQNYRLIVARETKLRGQICKF